MDVMDVLDALPLTSKRRTIAPICDTTLSHPSLSLTKKLKRMPHLFTRVLELPFHADTPVKVVESRNCYTFVVQLPGLVARDVKAEVMEIVPGASKVVIRGVESLNLENSEIDLWRFRLPPTTTPKDSLATYEHDMLTVTIPKAFVPCDDEVDMHGKCGGDSSVVLLQAVTVESTHALTTELSFSEQFDGEFDVETEEERMQREVLDDFESFGSPRWTRSARSSFSDLSDDNTEFETEEERIQREVLEDLENFGSPRRIRNTYSCTQSVSGQRTGSQDFLRSIGSWVGGFAIYVQ